MIYFYLAKLQLEHYNCISTVEQQWANKHVHAQKHIKPTFEKEFYMGQGMPKYQTQ